MQVGCGRAGFYSNDLLDNLARPSATTIVADLQCLEVGQWVPMSPSSTPTEKTAFRVDSFEVASSMLWAKPDGTWAWRLTPTTSNGTRLVTRIHAVYDWSHPLTAILGVVLMELGDFAMMRRMLRGIKARAEAVGDDESGTPAGCPAAAGWRELGGVDATAAEDPRGDRVRVPHVAGVELVSPPHRGGHQ